MRKDHRLALVALLTCSAPLSARGAESTVFAVFPIEDATKTLDDISLRTLSDYLAARVGTIPRVSIIPSSEVRARIDAQRAESYKACYDEACQIEIGKEVAANKAVATRISPVPDGCIVSSYVYDLARATTDATATVRSGCDQGALIGAMDQIATRFKEVFAPAKAAPMFGAVEVRSIPSGGQIILDAAPTGMLTPAELRSVPLGPHRIAVETEEARGEAQIEVKATRTASVTILLKTWPATLAIGTVPSGARITVRGKDVGVSPLVVEVQPGFVEVSADLADGRSAKASVHAKPSRQPKEVSLVLTERMRGEEPEPPAPKELKIGWLVTGGLMLGGAIVADTVPAPAHDRQIGPTDFIPVGLYVLGGIAALLGVVPAL